MSAAWVTRGFPSAMRAASIGAGLATLSPATAPAAIPEPLSMQSYEDVPHALTEPFQPPLRPFAVQQVPFNLVLFGGAPFARISKDTAVTQYRFRPLSLLAMMDPDVDRRLFLASWFLTFTFETIADPDEIQQSWLRSNQRPHSLIWGAPDDSRFPLRHAAYLRYHYPQGATPTTPPSSIEVGKKIGLRSGLFQVYGEWAREGLRWDWKNMWWKPTDPERVGVDRKLVQIKMQKSTASVQVGDGWLKQRKVRPAIFTKVMGVAAEEYFTWSFLARHYLAFWMPTSESVLPSLTKDEAYQLLLKDSELNGDLAIVDKKHAEVIAKLAAAEAAENVREIKFYQERVNFYARAREQIRTHLATFIEFNDPRATMRKFSEETRRLIFHLGLDDLEEGFRHSTRAGTEMFQVANFFNMVFDLAALRRDPNQSLLYHTYDALVADSPRPSRNERRRRYLRDAHIANRLLDAASPWFIGVFGVATADAVAAACRKFFEKAIEKHFWFEGVVHIWALWAVTWWYGLYIESFFKHQHPDVMYKVLTFNGQMSIAPLAMTLYLGMAVAAGYFGLKGVKALPHIFLNFRRQPVPGLAVILSALYMAWGFY